MRPYQSAAAVWAQCPGCQARAKRAPGAPTGRGWPSAQHQIPLQKASPHVANFSPARWVCREIPKPGDFSLCGALLQGLCGERGERPWRGRPFPLQEPATWPGTRCTSPRAKPALIFLGNLLLPKWSVASRAAEAGSLAAGLFSAPVSYGLPLSKLSMLPEDGSVGKGSGNNV